MFSRIKTIRSIKDISRQIDRLREYVNSADAVVIGAGAGLSVSAGFSYSGERFDKYFSDFKEKYGFADMYAGGFYPYKTKEEYWAFWSRNIMCNRYTDAPKPVYNELLELIRDKNYFVITTNVDHCFQKAGFDKKRLFYTQGDYGLFQCSVPCHNKTYDNEKAVREMFNAQQNMRIPKELIPRCRICGQPMTMNLRCDDTFVQDDGWYMAAERYSEFLREFSDKNILFLELGVGSNTPAIIKYPFWRMTESNPSAVYACVNKNEAYCPEIISDRSICIGYDIGDVINQL